MSVFNNITLTGGADQGYVNINDIAAFKNKTYALEDIPAQKTELKGVTVESISAEELEKRNRDRFEPSERDIFDPRNTIQYQINEAAKKIRETDYHGSFYEYNPKHIVSTLFDDYGRKRYSVNVDYEDGDTLLGYLKGNCRNAIENIGFNEDNIARIAADVGKEIDEMHKNGDFSDERYEQLNSEIENCTKFWVDDLNSCRASIRDDKERAAAYNKYGIEYKLQLRKKTREERKLEFLKIKQQIMKENPLDFNEFFRKINRMRFNTAEKQEASAQNDTE